MRQIAYSLYLLFVASWFLHLPTRFPVLGVIRMDLLLVAAISGLIFLSRGEENAAPATSNRTDVLLRILLIYMFLTLPLVEWPGSVVRYGIPGFIKAIVFYYFTVSLLTTERRFRTFLTVFLLCQAVRVVEPVFLNATTGYWGSRAHMSNWEFMERLSGAPSDVVNPNGLAFIILTIFPFFHYLASLSAWKRLQYLILAPVFVYALTLTGSRSGMIAFGVVILGLWIKSRHKVAVACVVAVVAVMGFGKLSGDLKDRYMSIVKSDTQNAVTATGRLEGMKADFRVALHRPLFGHGLGTSAEANGNFGEYAKIAHNLYAEIAQELGFIGLFLFLLFIRSIVLNFIASYKKLRADAGQNRFLLQTTHAMTVWIFMNLIFSLASFGLSSYEWYLFAGLSVVLSNIAAEQARAGKRKPAPEPVPFWIHEREHAAAT